MRINSVQRGVGLLDGAERRWTRAALCVVSLLALNGSVHALQTVTPTTVDGITILSGNVSVPAGSTFTFLGMYTDDSPGAESGLGLKVKYNPAHLTNVVISEEYTKCRIAAAQVQPLTATTAQAVMGWVDTSVRTSGAVGWPDLADTTAGGANPTCLNPGGINTDTAAGTAAAPGQKLFKITATMAAGCTSPGACTSTVLFDSEGNFSYAPTTPAVAGFTNKSFTIVGAAAPSCNLDADGNGGALDGFSDGIAILRYMLGIGNATFATGITLNSPRNTPALVKAYLDTQNLAAVSPTTPDGFVDGIIILRLMLGIGNATLLNGITLPPGAPTTAAAVRAQVNARCGTSF